MQKARRDVNDQFLKAVCSYKDAKETGDLEYAQTQWLLARAAKAGLQLLDALDEQIRPGVIEIPSHAILLKV